MLCMHQITFYEVLCSYLNKDYKHRSWRLVLKMIMKTFKGALNEGPNILSSIAYNNLYMLCH